MSVKVLLADDHEVIRAGLASMLAGANFKIVAEASTPAETVKLANKHKPEVILLDLRFGHHDAFDTIEKLRKDVPKAKIVVLSSYDNPTYVARTAAVGACDYVLKGCSKQELMAVVQAAADGKSPHSAGEQQRVVAAMSKRKALDADDAVLTARESQVLRHLALGLSNKEIARSLDISVETIKEHVQNLLRKLKVGDRTEAAVWAVRNKLL